MSDTNRWQTVKQTARQLDLSEMYIRKLVDDGALKGMRIPGGPRLIDKYDAVRMEAERKEKSGKNQK